MYTLKLHPEDFIVKEVSSFSFKGSGKYFVCILKKKNYTTIRAIEQVAKILHKKIKDIGFAGTKDKRAITEQFISIKNIKKENIKKIKLKDIELKFIGYSNKPISLGDLKENEFIIAIRNVKEKEITNLRKKIGENCLMPNFFGEQRFSKNNIKIGKLLLKSNFKEAIRIILKTNPDYKDEINEFIKNKPNDFVGTLKLIPKKLLLLYIHAYQSYLWNKTLEDYIKTNKKNIKIPLIGFSTEIENKEINKIITKIMEKENITFRSFINRQIPEISLEGDSRDAFVEIKDLKILKRGRDFVKLSLKLPKGSYATVAVDFLLN